MVQTGPQYIVRQTPESIVKCLTQMRPWLGFRRKEIRHGQIQFIRPAGSPYDGSVEDKAIDVSFRWTNSHGSVSGGMSHVQRWRMSVPPGLALKRNRNR